jgi:hypothetical protein
MPDSVLPDRDKRIAEEQIKRTNEFIKFLESIGIEVSSSLKKALSRLQTVVTAINNTVDDLGAAFEEASKAVAALESDLNSACLRLDETQQDVCLAGVARRWPVRSVNFTLDPKNPNSVTALFIKKTMQRYALSAICQNWDRCKKEVERNARFPPASPGRRP